LERKDRVDDAMHATRAAVEEGICRAAASQGAFHLSTGESVVSEKNPNYRVEIKSSGTPPNVTFRWNIYRNQDVLPILRSQQHFVSRMAGLADANRSRLKLADANASG